MPTKDEREVTVEGYAWVKLPMHLRLRVKGEPHDGYFEVLRVVEAIPRSCLEMGVKLDDPSLVEVQPDDSPFWTFQDDLRADEGWDDEEPE